MERKKRSEQGEMATAVIAMLCVAMWMSGSTYACSAGNKGCKECIVKQLDCECSGCRPILRCLAGCLWDGVSPSKCIHTCDSSKGKGKPRLSRCKKCLSACKCICAQHSHLHRFHPSSY